MAFLGDAAGWLAFLITTTQFHDAEAELVADRSGSAG
jgi:hypothetical protein